MALEYTQHHPVAADGLQLFAHRWAPSRQEALAELLVVHGYMEHGGRYQEMAHALAEHGIVTTAIDYRGHGRAQGRRGHVDEFYDYYFDLDAGLALLGSELPKFVLGHSLGGLLTLDYVHAKHPLPIRGAIVTNPFLEVAFPVAGLKAWAGRQLAKFAPAFQMPSGLDPGGLSHEPAVAVDYVADPLVFDKIRVGWFQETSEAQERVKSIRVLPCPFLYIYSNADPIAAPAASQDFVDQVQCEDLKELIRDGEYHEVLNETNRETLFDTIAEWIVAHR